MRVLVSVLDVAAGASSTVFLDVEAGSSVASIVPTLLNVTASEASTDQVQIAVDGVVFPPPMLNWARRGCMKAHGFPSWTSLLGHSLGLLCLMRAYKCVWLPAGEPVVCII